VTALWHERQSGRVEPVDEETERTMYEWTIERLGAAGLDMYEISNFAVPGHESRHNLAYWSNDAYFGFGVGAARYLRGVRSVNTRDINAYLRRIESGMPATGPTEELSAEDRARETAILMLRRTRCGIERSDFELRTGFDLDSLALDTITRYQMRGLLEDNGRRVRLSHEGLFVADQILCDFL
jgi:oxygen-independent coproporphyrinogen III oxidase